MQAVFFMFSLAQHFFFQKVLHFSGKILNVLDTVN